jgi:hypothetical protein
MPSAGKSNQRNFFQPERAAHLAASGLNCAAPKGGTEPNSTSMETLQ